jgi:hypothetical protein
MGKITTSLFSIQNIEKSRIAQYTSSEDIFTRNIQNNLEINRRFCDLMLAILMTNNPGNAKQYLPEKKQTALIDIITPSVVEVTPQHI